MTSPMRLSGRPMMIAPRTSRQNTARDRSNAARSLSGWPAMWDPRIAMASACVSTAVTTKPIVDRRPVTNNGPPSATKPASSDRDIPRGSVRSATRSCPAATKPHRRSTSGPTVRSRTRPMYSDPRRSSVRPPTRRSKLRLRIRDAESGSASSGLGGGWGGAGMPAWASTGCISAGRGASDGGGGRSSVMRGSMRKRRRALDQGAQSSDLHVAARGDDAHALAWTDRDASVEHGREGRRTGPLEHLLHPLRGESHAREDRRVVQQHDLVDVPTAHRQRPEPGEGRPEAVGDGVRADLHRLAVLEPDRDGVGLVRLHAVDADARPSLLHGCGNAADEPASADPDHEHVELGYV